jgi:hypothetical protein
MTAAEAAAANVTIHVGRLRGPHSESGAGRAGDMPRLQLHTGVRGQLPQQAPGRGNLSPLPHIPWRRSWRGLTGQQQKVKGDDQQLSHHDRYPAPGKPTSTVSRGNREGRPSAAIPQLCSGRRLTVEDDTCSASSPVHTIMRAESIERTSQPTLDLVPTAKKTATASIMTTLQSRSPAIRSATV